MTHWHHALQHLLRAEGGLRVHVVEPGGAANFGITVVAFLEWKHKKGQLKDVPVRDEAGKVLNPNPRGIELLKAITQEEVAQFYDDVYRVPMGLDNVKGLLTCIVLLDQAVNRGKGGVKKGLAQTLTKRFNKVGLIETTKFADFVEAVNVIEDRRFFWQFLCDAQDNYVNICVSKPERLADLPGWINRAQNLLELLV